MDILTQLSTCQDQLFYSIDDKSITYQQAYIQVKKLAKQFRMLKGPIVIYGHKQIEVVLCILGCIQAKKTYIMVDSSTPLARVNEIIQLSKACYCIGIEQISIISIPVLSYQQLLDLNKESIEEKNTIAYILFTSGSTGKPKGVPISYANLEHFIKCSTQSLPIEPCSLLSVSNFSFDLSLMDLYYALYSRCSIISVNKENKSDLAYMKGILNQIQYIVATPTYYNYLLLDHDFSQKDYPSIHTFFSCGERLEVQTAKRLMQRFPHATIINAYGPTEATCFISYHIVTKEDLFLPLLPVGHIDTSFVSISTIQDEIILNGKSVFQGYLGQDANQKENGYYRYPTGDLGYIEDSLLYITQRKDQQIKYQGYRIEINDIEMNLIQIEGINQACVIPQYRNGIVKYIKAYVSGDLKDELVIKQQLRKSLPSYMIPKTIICLDTMPMNENGKINRKELI